MSWDSLGAPAPPAALSPARTESIPCRPWRLRDARRPASTKGRGEALLAGLLAPAWAAPPLSSALVLLCAHRTTLRARGPQASSW